MPKARYPANKKSGRNTSGALRVRRPSGAKAGCPRKHRRSHKRLRYMVEVMFGTRYGSFSGRLQNLSRGGAYIETAGPIPIGSTVLATIPFRKKIGWVFVAARVVRRDEGAIGLKFSS